MEAEEETVDSRFVVCVEDISNVWALIKPVSSFVLLRYSCDYLALNQTVRAFGAMMWLVSEFVVLSAVRMAIIAGFKLLRGYRCYVE
jgi:hypothetical protein